MLSPNRPSLSTEFGVASGNLLALYNLAKEAQRGREEPAIQHYKAVLAVKSKFGRAHFYLGDALMRSGRYEEALVHYQQVVEIHPLYGPAHLRRAMVLIRLKRYSEAKARLQEGHSLLPEDAGIAHALARILAACPEQEIRDGLRALQLTQQAYQSQHLFGYTVTLAMAYAEAGQFKEAVRMQRAAIEATLRAEKMHLLARSVRTWLASNEASPAVSPGRTTTRLSPRPLPT